LGLDDLVFEERDTGGLAGMAGSRSTGGRGGAATNAGQRGAGEAGNAAEAGNGGEAGSSGSGAGAEGGKAGHGDSGGSNGAGLGGMTAGSGGRGGASGAAGSAGATSGGRLIRVSPTGTDNGDCGVDEYPPCRTIRYAVGRAGGRGAVFLAAGSYEEVGIALNRDVTIVGAGADVTHVVGVSDGTVFGVSSGVIATIRGVSISRTASSPGRAVDSVGHLTLEDSVISGLPSDVGTTTAVSVAYEPATIRRCRIENNAVRGIEGRYGPIWIEDSVIAQNTGEGSGSALNIGGEGSELHISRSAIVGNQSTTGGTVILLGADTVGTMTNVTISGNAGGAAVALAGGSEIHMEYVTIANNEVQTGKISSYQALLTLHGVVLEGDGSNCTGDGLGITSLGQNLVSDDTCEGALGDIRTSNPMLGPLADNGGLTPTHLPLAGSPALDLGDGTGCPAVDQRGVTRPQGTACDSGAVEVEQ
jgi:hypothetical protein